MEQVHGTTVALGNVGVLICGVAGAGKSDLALRLIDQGARLVADDQTMLSRDGTRLMAAAPAATAGRMEVRGLGIVEVPHQAQAEVCLVVDLVEADNVERLPQPEWITFDGVRLPRLALAAFEASATAKLRLAVKAMGVARRGDDG